MNRKRSQFSKKWPRLRSRSWTSDQLPHHHHQRACLLCVPAKGTHWNTNCDRMSHTFDVVTIIQYLLAGKWYLTSLLWTRIVAPSRNWTTSRPLRCGSRKSCAPWVLFLPRLHSSSLWILSSSTDHYYCILRKPYRSNRKLRPPFGNTPTSCDFDTSPSGVNVLLSQIYV